MRKKPSIALYWLACSLVLSLIPTFATGQGLEYKGVWYRPARASFLVELMDDVKASGATYSPREAAILDLDQNFSAIKSQLAANSVVVRLPDDDSFWAQVGCCATYDPISRPRQETGVAEEIILSIANKYGLKVIFVVEPSPYKRNVDDTFSTVNNPPSNPAGAWNFIHQFFDPALYYGVRCTTKLELVFLPNTCAGTYFNDPRVAGWLFGVEWKPENPPDVAFINKYWNFFYSLVHWNGSQTGFAGIYLNGGLDDINNVQARIPAFKSLFSPITTNTQPDVFGLEWYGGGNYNFSNVGNDMGLMMSLMCCTVYNVPYNRIGFFEGGSNQNNNPGRAQFYRDAIGVAANFGAKALMVWHSDPYVNLADCESGTDPNPIGQDLYALFSGNTFALDGCTSYPPNPYGYHEGDQFVYRTDTRSVGYGRYQYGTLKDIGVAVQDSFDTTPPTTPTGLIATVMSGTQVR